MMIYKDNSGVRQNHNGPRALEKKKKKKTPRPENEASTDSVVHHTPFQDDTNIKEDGT